MLYRLEQLTDNNVSTKNKETYVKVLRMYQAGTGKMAQWLGAMAVLPETWIWVPEPHGIPQLSVTLALEDPAHPWALEYWTCKWHIDLPENKTFIYIKQNIKCVTYNLGFKYQLLGGGKAFSNEGGKIKINSNFSYVHWVAEELRDIQMVL